VSDRYPQVEVKTRGEWREWLVRNHDRSSGIWLVTFKQGSGGARVTYDEIVEEALCFGWVDSLPRRVDDRRTSLRLTPRKPTSRWSAANKARVERMTAAGMMTPAGVDLVEHAKLTGLWNALDDVELLVEPEDLRAALDADPHARGKWDGFAPSARRGILEWILSAKRPETRAKRIRTTVEEAAAGRRANQWRRAESP